MISTGGDRVNNALETRTAWGLLNAGGGIDVTESVASYHHGLLERLRCRANLARTTLKLQALGVRWSSRVSGLPLGLVAQYLVRRNGTNGACVSRFGTHAVDAPCWSPRPSYLARICARERDLYRNSDLVGAAHGPFGQP
jgi:hypothetical protein